MGNFSGASATAATVPSQRMGSDTVTFTTSDGLRLHGDLLQAVGPVRGAVVVCHPHPLYGGDRFNSVVDAVWRSLAEAGMHALRFDFRGTNASEGVHGHGVDEILDVVAGLDLVAQVLARSGTGDGAGGGTGDGEGRPTRPGTGRNRHDLPIWLVGYSFGAMVALDVVDPRVTGWVGVAAPLVAAGAHRAAADDDRPTLLLAPEHDQLGTPDEVGPLVAAWRATTLEIVPMADHSLVGRANVVARAVNSFVTAPR